MARTRHQNPKPEIAGKFWYVRIWQDTIVDGVRTRQRKRVKIAPATLPADEAQEIANGVLEPLNASLIAVGSGTNFRHFVQTRYTADLNNLASSTRAAYAGEISRHLLPALGGLSFHEIDRGLLKELFNDMVQRGVPYPTLIKTRDALSHILRSAIDDELILRNPLAGLKLPRDKRRKQPKAVITPQEFDKLVQLIPEPYASAIYVAGWTGVRPSELFALKWRSIDEARNTITISERFCRGDWAVPKTPASCATIPVAANVLARLRRLKTLTISVRAGRAVRHYSAVKGTGPDDLIFQGQVSGPLDAHNVLNRHLAPAAKKLGLRVNWQVLRRATATWLLQAGVDPKTAQGQMRHADPSTTMKIYAQVQAASQRQAVNKLVEFAGAQELVPTLVPLVSQSKRVN